MHFPIVKISEFYLSVKKEDKFGLIVEFDFKVFVVLVLVVKNKLTFWNIITLVSMAICTSWENFN